MKRSKFIAVCLLILCACVLSALPASADDTPLDAARTFVWQGGELTSEDTTAAFWEYPQLTAGQSRRGGRLTLINQGGGAVTARLDRVQLPYDNDDALRYLNALHLTVRDGDRLLYDGSFARLNDEGLLEPVSLKRGETRTLSIDLSCDFAYEGEAACEQVMYWDWQLSASFRDVAQSALDAWFIWVPAVLLIVALIVWRRMRRPRARRVEPTEQSEPTESTEPTESPEPTESTEQPESPERPPDVPAPAPRTPVTLSIDPGEAPGRPARRHKAAHAAPRHAKKK